MNEKEDQGYGQLTNAEIYGALALILMELQKINKILDSALPTLKIGPATTYDLKPLYTIT